MSKRLNNEELLRALSDIDDKYIEEALNYSTSAKKAKISTLRSRALIGSIAAVLIAVVGGVIFLNSSKNFDETSEAEHITAHNAASEDDIESIAINEEVAFGAEDAEEVDTISDNDVDAIEDEAVVDSNFVRGFDINLSSVFEGDIASDYEYADGIVRLSYFDESGELLLEIYHYLDDRQIDLLGDSSIEYFQRFDAVESSDGTTLYHEDDDYLGAVITRNGELYIVRTPLGVSEDALQTIINQI